MLKKKIMYMEDKYAKHRVYLIGVPDGKNEDKKRESLIEEYGILRKILHIVIS